VETGHLRTRQPANTPRPIPKNKIKTATAASGEANHPVNDQSRWSFYTKNILKISVVNTLKIDVA
jgi:hypothetical protein